MDNEKNYNNKMFEGPKHEGSRGRDFRDMIEKILIKSKLKTKYLSVLLSDESFELYNIAFTSKTVNPLQNYEYFEIIGDVAVNHFIVDYMVSEFPELNSSENVPVTSRLKQMYASTKILYDIALNLGFWPFISATEVLRNSKKKNLLEDVFEAFIGVVEKILNEKFIRGVGYAIVYNIMESIFNEFIRVKITFKYEVLYDAKTRLKEKFDLIENQKKYGKVVKDKTYINSRVLVNNHELTKSEIRLFSPNGSFKVYGEGIAPTAKQAEQVAAQNALDNLETLGLQKEVASENIKFLYNKYG
jgi:dsRNA-specific ribonuclease